MSKRNLTAVVGAAIATLSICAAPASAQNALDGIMDAEQETEIYCVYDILSQTGDIYEIADVFVDPDASEAEIEAADGILSEAVGECMAAYDWTEAAQEFAAVIGIHGSVIDVTTADLALDGMTEESIQGIFDVLDLLEDKDMETFKSPAWLADTRFQKRINRSLVSAGVPNKEEFLSSSMLVLESSILAADAIVDWLLETGVGPTADAAPAPAIPSSASGKSSGSKKSKSGKASASAGSKPAPRAPKLELTGSGTGWYVAEGGYIVTNAHVVEGCKRMTLKSGLDLDIVDVADGEDLALLRGESSERPLTIRDTRSVRLAEDVLVAGFPLGGILSSGINVTVGTVSAQAGMGDDERRFQFTAPVQPGNSGGPVLDMSGNVIGVVVSKLNAMTIQDQVGDIPQNVNFGIALTSLVDFLNDNDVDYARQASGAKLDKVDLAELARASTVLLQCYQ